MPLEEAVNFEFGDVTFGERKPWLLRTACAGVGVDVTRCRPFLAYNKSSRRVLGARCVNERCPHAEECENDQLRVHRLRVAGREYSCFSNTVKMCAALISRPRCLHLSPRWCQGGAMHAPAAPRAPSRRFRNETLCLLALCAQLRVTCDLNSLTRTLATVCASCRAAQPPGGLRQPCVNGGQLHSAPGGAGLPGLHTSLRAQDPPAGAARSHPGQGAGTLFCYINRP